MRRWLLHILSVALAMSVFAPVAAARGDDDRGLDDRGMPGGTTIEASMTGARGWTIAE